MNKQLLSSALFIFLLATSIAFNFVQFRQRTGNKASIGTSNFQSTILCDVAKEQLKEHWSEQQKNIEHVIHVVNSPKEMQAKLETDLSEISKNLNLTGDQRVTFEPAYKKLFEAHVDQ